MNTTGVGFLFHICINICVASLKACWCFTAILPRFTLAKTEVSNNMYVVYIDSSVGLSCCEITRACSNLPLSETLFTSLVSSELSSEINGVGGWSSRHYQNSCSVILLLLLFKR